MLRTLEVQRRMHLMSKGYLRTLKDQMYRSKSSQSLKLPNILLFCHKQDSNLIDSAKQRLTSCFGSNTFDLKECKNLKEFFEIPWQGAVQALIFWCNDLQSEDQATLQKIFCLLSDYLHNGGKVILFDQTPITNAFFQPVFNAGFEFNKEGNTTFIHENQEITLLNDKTSFRKSFMQHEGGIFKVETNEKTSYLASNLELPMSEGKISACLLPLLKNDTFTKSKPDDPNFALKLLIESVGLQCVHYSHGERVKGYQLGVAHYTSPAQMLNFKLCIKECKNSGIKLLNSTELSFEEVAKALQSDYNGNECTVVDGVTKDNFQYPHFNWKDFSRNLLSTSYGHFTLHFDVVGTTMDIMNRLEPSLPQSLPVLVIANQQCQGKGRGGNRWLSPGGCAMFTLTIKVSQNSNLGQRCSLIQHMMSVAVVHAIRTIPGLEQIDIRVKWPNDIYFGNKTKLGGILVQSSFVRGYFVFRIGCGVNVYNDKPLISLNTIMRDVYNISTGLTCEKVIARTVSVFEQLVNDFNNNCESFFNLYYKYWIHENAQVTFNENNKQEVGIIVGVDECGFLLVKTDLKTITLHPDGNSFDAMKNLISPKQ